MLIIVFCVDAKMNFDDNAAFRQKEIFEMEDTSDKVRDYGTSVLRTIERAKDLLLLLSMNPEFLEYCSNYQL